jgi:UDP-N-acetylmuramoyl-tripeptide--D-alanyl-D-alanine ligase
MSSLLAASLARPAWAAPTLVVCVLALALSSLRWLRVAQREHYLPGLVTRFAGRWIATSAANRALTAVAVLGLIGTAVGVAPAALLCAGAAAVGPIGLTLRGRTSKLAWTGRLRRLAAASALVAAVAIALGSIGGWRWSVLAAAVVVGAAPLVVDAGAALALPVERRLTLPFIRQATQRLRAVRPLVVAITGSYGKTSTKGYVAHLLGANFAVTPSPASFNNRAGLARAINEHLSPGAEVFVAEMGTYGPGEIADLCRWIPPQISIITAIGPVHLERMKSERRIAEAKSEILGPAPTVVLNVDHPLLAELAERSATQGKRVWRASASDESADVVVERHGAGLVVRARPGPGQGDLGLVAELEQVEASTTNVACAVAVALELGVPVGVIAQRLAGIPTAPHRRSVQTGAGGAAIIDDTYNSNPAGAAAALAVLAGQGSPTGRRVVVTPGMVELGPEQQPRNATFAAACAEAASDLVIVGRTNAKALAAGAAGTSLRVHHVADRTEAVAWVSAQLGPGDAVLYENDLPDHFP